MQIVWSFSPGDYIVLVMKLIDDRNGIIIRYKKHSIGGCHINDLCDSPIVLRFQGTGHLPFAFSVRKDMIKV